MPWILRLPFRWESVERDRFHRGPWRADELGVRGYLQPRGFFEQGEDQHLGHAACKSSLASWYNLHGPCPPNRPRRKVRPSSDGAEDCFGEIRVGPVSDPTLSVWRRRGREPVPETGESGSLVGVANLEVIRPGVQAYLLHLACPSWFGICETLCSARESPGRAVARIRK